MPGADTGAGRVGMELPPEPATSAMAMTMQQSSAGHHRPLQALKPGE